MARLGPAIHVLRCWIQAKTSDGAVCAGHDDGQRRHTMSDTAAIPNRAKKGVGLSGVTAGNTALCTVGRTGNDLHYRGYDILDIAGACEFEEIAYLLVHGKLPTQAELTATRPSCAPARPAGIGEADAGSAAARGASDGRDAHRGVGARLRAAGEGRSEPARRTRHRRPADGLSRLDAALLVSTTRTTASGSTSRPTTTRSAATSCICCTASRPARCSSAPCTPR